MAKIKFNKWKSTFQFEKTGSGYTIQGLEVWRTSAEHGRNQGEVKCPCCDAITSIYFWSFRGSGKRCSNCNVFLGSGGAFVATSEVTGETSLIISKLTD